MSVTRSRLRLVIGSCGLVSGLMGLAVSAVAECLLVGVMVMAAPSVADAQSCSAISANVNQTYTGTALSRSITRNISCTGIAAGDYTLCINGAVYPGTGGTTVSPYRQLDNGSGDKADWQLHDSNGRAISNTGHVVGSATAAQLNGSFPFLVEFRFPVQSVPYGTYATHLDLNINVRPGSDCSTAFVTQVDYAIDYAVSIPASCSALTANTVNFGDITSLASPVNAQAAVRVTCTEKSPYTVYMGTGLNASGGTNRMRNGSNYISYGLFRNAGRTNAWTTTSGPAGTGIGTQQTLTVYAQIPSQATPPVGTYTDTVVVTLAY